MFLFSKKNKTIEAVPKSERLVLADDNRTKLTLGTGDLRVAVKLPIGEDLNEWIACNTADFFSEITLLWGLVLDGTDENIILNSELGIGFPHGIEYRWADADKSKTPIKCNGPTYCEFVLTWVEKELNNDKMFPKSSDQTFPKQPIFLAQIKIIYTKLFRIFAIIYSHHFMTLEKMGAVAHLNTCFKHFIFFCFEFDLVKSDEMECLNEIITELRTKYNENRLTKLNDSNSP